MRFTPELPLAWPTTHPNLPKILPGTAANLPDPADILWPVAVGMDPTGSFSVVSRLQNNGTSAEAAGSASCW